MKTAQLIILAFLTCVAVNPLSGQDFNTYSFDPPVPVKAVNSVEQEEAAPLISPKGDRIYFTRTANVVQFDKRVSIHEIWFSDYLEDGWTNAVKAFHPLNDNQNTAVIGFKDDGLYLFGVYSGGLKNKNGASETHVENGAWTKPQSLEIPDLKIKGGYYGLSMHSSERILLVSKGDSGNEDLFVTLMTPGGQWSELINLGPTINSKGYEIAPFLSDDSFHLFFSRGNQTKDADIYVSKRMDNTWQNWTEPERLPEPINSDLFDAYFSISSDSTVLFSSDRMGSNDIYESKLRLRNILPQPEELLDSELVAVNQETTLAEEPEIIEEQPVSAESEFVKIQENQSRADEYVFFEFGQFSLSDHSKMALDEVVEKLLKAETLSIEVIGHADYIDHEDFNQELSTKRSAHVAEYLISQGVAESRITTLAFGELLPISNNESELGRRLNRRVEIFISTESNIETSPNNGLTSSKKSPSALTERTLKKEVHGNQ